MDGWIGRQRVIALPTWQWLVPLQRCSVAVSHECWGVGVFERWGDGMWHVEQPVESLSKCCWLLVFTLTTHDLLRLFVSLALLVLGRITCGLLRLLLRLLELNPTIVLDCFP